MHGFIGGYSVDGEHAHLNVPVHFIIERPAVYCLRLGYVIRQDLFHDVSRCDDFDPTHRHAPDFPRTVQ